MAELRFKPGPEKPRDHPHLGTETPPPCQRVINYTRVINTKRPLVAPKTLNPQVTFPAMLVPFGQDSKLVVKVALMRSTNPLLWGCRGLMQALLIKHLVATQLISSTSFPSVIPLGWIFDTLPSA